MCVFHCAHAHAYTHAHTNSLRHMDTSMRMHMYTCHYAHTHTHGHTTRTHITQRDISLQYYAGILKNLFHYSGISWSNLGAFYLEANQTALAQSAFSVAQLMEPHLVCDKMITCVM